MSCLCSCCASLTCGLCTSLASGISQKSARIAYCALFGASLILSWILREVAAPILDKFPCKLPFLSIFFIFFPLVIWNNIKFRLFARNSYVIRQLFNSPFIPTLCSSFSWFTKFKFEIIIRVIKNNLDFFLDFFIYPLNSASDLYGTW